MCVDECSENINYIENGQCRSRCTANPFYSVAGQTRNCVAACEKNSCATSDENGLLECQEYDGDQLWPAGGLCNVACSPGTVFDLEKNACAKRCPSLYYVNENDYPQCVSACPEGFDRVLSGTFGLRCVNSCPPGTKLEDGNGALGECVDDLSALKTHNVVSGSILALSLVFLVVCMLVLTYGWWRPKMVKCVGHMKRKKMNAKANASPQTQHN